MCKSVCEMVLAVLILIFTFWQTTYSTWIVALLAVVLLIHSFGCTKCFSGKPMAKQPNSSRKR